MAKKNTFSKPVQYNGIVFDSTLECQYALQIEDQCVYFYHPITIWYDKKDRSKFGKQTCDDKYIPDFLVRNLQDNSCYLVEIKSSKDRYHKDTLLKQFHAENHIKRLGHNWKYIILTERDIEVPKSKWSVLKKARNTRVNIALKKNHNKLHNRYSREKISNELGNVPIVRFRMELNEIDYKHFVKTGVIRNLDCNA